MTDVQSSSSEMRFGRLAFLPLTKPRSPISYDPLVSVELEDALRSRVSSHFEGVKDFEKNVPSCFPSYPVSAVAQ